MPPNSTSPKDEDSSPQDAAKKCCRKRESHTSTPNKNLTDGEKHLHRDLKLDHITDTVGKSNVTVKICSKGPKRQWDKRHYCVYCKKPQSKMARHLQWRHGNEKEMALAICLPPKSKMRCQRLDQLCRKGNYYHNIEVLQKGQGE